MGGELNDSHTLDSVRHRTETATEPEARRVWHARAPQLPLVWAAAPHLPQYLAVQRQWQREVKQHAVVDGQTKHQAQQKVLVCEWWWGRVGWGMSVVVTSPRSIGRDNEVASSAQDCPTPRYRPPA